MLEASDLFKDALRTSHRALTRVTLLIPEPEGGFREGSVLSVADGSLSVDGTRNVWRTGSINVAPSTSLDRDELYAIDSTTRLRIERGIRFPNGDEEWVTIGLVQVQDTELTLSRGTVSISFSDLGSLVEDYELTLMYVPQDMDGNRLTTVEAIQDLVTAAVVWDTIPGWDIDPGVDTAVKPIDTTVFNGSRWAAIQELSESIGAITYAKPDGRWAIRLAEADLENPVAEYATGQDGIIVDFTRKHSRDKQYNAIPLRWESPQIGGLVFIVDADAASPTFWNGPFGRKPRDEETNDLILTEEQAIAAARGLLDQYRGLTASLTFESIHNPLLEPLDVVLLRNGEAMETHIIDSINYPLTGGTMTCVTRLLRVEVLGRELV